jgi:hypothetical protein
MASLVEGGHLLLLVCIKLTRTTMRHMVWIVSLVAEPLLTQLFERATLHLG